MERDQQLDGISLEVLWTRLISIANEAAVTLVRTAFSPIIRESNDYACVLFDQHGLALAENTEGIPSFNAIMGRTMKQILIDYPAPTWSPGDVVIVNDPWVGAGHLPDLTAIVPVFFQERLVAFCGTTAHMLDIGGIVWSVDGSEIYEEGLRIRPLRLYTAGQPSAELMAIIRDNVRLPDQVLGDIHALIAANRTAAQGLIELMESESIYSLSEIAREMNRRSEAMMRQAIAQIPAGHYTHQIETDGVDGRPIRICAAVTVAGDEMTVDYAGSSPQVRRGINCPSNYTWAYTCHAIKCLIDPATRRNEGSYRPITIKSPEGSVMNSRVPAAVAGRHLVGHLTYAAVYGALADVLPDKVIADSGSSPNLRVIFSGARADGGKFGAILFNNGGMGARPTDDGLSCTIFPSNSIPGSMEIIEALAPLVVWQKELAQNSGGAGQFRGGLGQDVEVEVCSDTPITLSLMVDRVQHPALGRAGGHPGGPAVITVNGQPPATYKGRSALQPGDRVRVLYPGGGGFGQPIERDRGRVKADLKNELISDEEARNVYGFQG